MNTNEFEARVEELVATGLSKEEAIEMLKAEADAANDESTDDSKDESERGVDVSKEKSSYEQIVNNLIKQPDNIYYRNVKVKTAKVTKKDEYFMVSLSVVKDLRAMVANTDGTFVEGSRNIIFTTNYTLGGVIKNTDNISWIANRLVENADVFEAVLAGSRIDIINEPIHAGDEYINPFSSRREGTVFEHDTFINHIVGIHVSTETAEDIRDAKREMIKDMFRKKLS